MASQKYENILNLALETDETEREKSRTLNIGYNEEERTWEVIIRYANNLDELIQLGIGVTYLSANYAILNVPERYIRELGTFRNVIYVEMPKSVYLSVNNGIRVSCINELQLNSFSNKGGLFGQGIICGIVDSGIDYENRAFRNSDGTTRILELWDQNIPGNPPEGYSIGTVYSEQEINEALMKNSQNEMFDIVPSRDISGHGTHVAGIMAGNFSEDVNNNLGIATKSRLVVVKLNTIIDNGYPRTTELMTAVDYLYKTAVKYNMPMAMNISFGNNYGSHDGTSIIETFIDDIANLWKMTICIGTGNEGNTAGHSLEFYRNDETKNNKVNVGSLERTINIQIWKTYEDNFDFTIIAPDGTSKLVIQNVLGNTKAVLEGNIVLVYYGEPSPYSPFQEIYIDIIPSLDRDYITSGEWNIQVRAVNVITGRIDMWLPDSAALNFDTGFLKPDSSVTLTIPSTSSSSISVGAYNSLDFSYADFSGRGFTRLTNQVRPDIVAPGVNITSAAVGGGLTDKSGTSMATPFVTGSAALLMEWGIVRGNDQYLYGEKVKAYLIKGAKQLSGLENPNPLTGWGALCVRDSLPV